jgi:hypothetical protein
MPDYRGADIVSWMYGSMLLGCRRRHFQASLLLLLHVRRALC